MAKQTSQVEKHTQKHRDLVSIHEQHKKTLENEIKRYRMEMKEIESRAKHLEQERQSSVQEARTLKSKLDAAAAEELDAKEHSIIELRENLRETELKTKTAKAQYERARVENNDLQKRNCSI